MPQVGTLTRAITPIGDIMLCLPIYCPHSSPVIVILFVVIFVVYASPNNNLIRFNFLSQHYIYTFFLVNLSMSFDLLFDSVFSNLWLSWAVTTEQSKRAFARVMTPIGVYKSTVSYVCFSQEH